MSPLNRAVRQKAPPIVVRVRRIKHVGRPVVRPIVRRDPAAGPIQDLSGLILYGQG